MIPEQDEMTRHIERAQVTIIERIILREVFIPCIVSKFHIKFYRNSFGFYLCVPFFLINSQNSNPFYEMYKSFLLIFPIFHDILFLFLLSIRSQRMKVTF